jgi:membrane-bound serine protease (ClpP class)
MKKFSILTIGYILSIILTLGAVSFQPITGQTETTPLAIQLTSSGPITPILSEYLARGIDAAKANGANVIVLELDTPGGGIDLMSKIVQQIRTSEIPIIVYVSPQNAMAGSAGTLITLAGHLSAMAPETTIGAASPVGSQGEDIGATLESKIKEALRAQVRAIASSRSPEAIALAEDTIENATAVTVEEALAIGLVDYKAVDIVDLLKQVDGRTVLVNDKPVTLDTHQARVQVMENTLIEELLLLLVNPNLVFILLALGVQAILIEISSPGGWVAGFVGVICLSLATYGLGILPVNWFGALFLLLAFVLFILDIKAPTHGALTTAGTISFISGALILFNTTRWPGFPQVNVFLVVGMGLAFAAFFLFLLSFALRAQKSPLLFGPESLPGKSGWAETDILKAGMVRIDGELWQAKRAADSAIIQSGDEVLVQTRDGLHLVVGKKNQGSQQ